MEMISIAGFSNKIKNMLLIETPPHLGEVFFFEFFDDILGYLRYNREQELFLDQYFFQFDENKRIISRWVEKCLGDC